MMNPTTDDPRIVYSPFCDLFRSFAANFRRNLRFAAFSDFGESVAEIWHCDDR